jgi:hypothetical protein
MRQYQDYNQEMMISESKPPQYDSFSHPNPQNEPFQEQRVVLPKAQQKDVFFEKKPEP